MNALRAVKGMVDIFPQDSGTWQFLEQSVREVLTGYGYGEIRLPIVEPTSLFNRSIGEVTDIVEKEMYSFDDRNGDSLTLRPEGTAGCVRAAIQGGVLKTTQRYWYAGPMFRYERPQRGRQRQFHQVGAEAFGVASPDMDAEVIVMTARLWQKLGLSEGVELQINSIGNNEARKLFRCDLVQYLEQHKDQLDEDSLRRLETNPLRILDSKSATTRVVLQDAPIMSDYLDEESAKDFAMLCDLLTVAGVAYTINPSLVRGLDYYNKTVFEWVTDRLGAQGTICAGGRYDGLVEQLGGKATPGVGFAMGMERLVLLLEEMHAVEAVSSRVDVYVVAVGELAYREALATVEGLRASLAGFTIVQHTGGGSFKSQMKKADKSGARIALIWGEDEVAAAQVSVKYLRAEQGDAPRREQSSWPLSEIKSVLIAALTNNE